jgi:hypothetical protein
MSRLQLIERIVAHLHKLDDEVLEDFLLRLENDFIDENLDVVTYGADDTEHLLSSSHNVKILSQAVEDLRGQELLTIEPSKYVA